MRGLNVSYKDEIVAGHHTRERDYWLKKLSGCLEKTCFPYDRNKTNQSTGDAGIKSEFQLSGELFLRLMFLGNNSDSRLHIILSSVLVVLLSRYTGSNDIIFGTPTNKQQIEAKFINTVLIVRNQLNATQTFKDLLMQVRQTLKDATENVNYPLDTLLNKLGLPAVPDQFPLFDVSLLLENIHDREYLRAVALNIPINL